jgi:hypothetical protein
MRRCREKERRIKGRTGFVGQRKKEKMNREGTVSDNMGPVSRVHSLRVQSIILS